MTAVAGFVQDVPLILYRVLWRFVLIPKRADLELVHRARKTVPCLRVLLPQLTNNFEWFAISASAIKRPLV